MARHMVGEIEVVGITDGARQFTPDLFPGADEAHINALLKTAGSDGINTNFNAFVVKTGKSVMLIDAGPRDLMGPTAGGLLDGLRGEGIAPSDITHLVFTHIHPDHIAGALTPDGKPVFENAAVSIAEADFSFWTDPGNFTTTPEMITHWHQLAMALKAAYGERIDPVGMTADIISGVSLMPLAGHTPGHVGVRVSDGAAQFLHVADIVHAPDIQLADPEIGIVFDLDGDAARATRKRVLDELANEGTVFSGGHLITPKFARLEAAGSGYRLVEG